MYRREFLAAATGVALTPMGPSGALREQLEANAQEAIALRACPGVQIAVSRRGRLEYSRGFGFADIEHRARVGRRSIFRIGSLTKQFTAAAAIKLATMGQLELEAPISNALPFMASLPNTTPLELMQQTAGLHSDENPAPLPGSPTQIELAEAIAAQAQPFDFPPGTAWHYSNANYIMLGALIEAVTKSPLSEAYDSLLFDPIGLPRTRMDHLGDHVSNRAAGYTTNGQGELVLGAEIDVAQAGGAGALRSTGEELCRWHHALLGGRLFGEAEIALMLAPGKLRDGRLSGANRFSPDDAHYGDVQYACGLLVSAPDDAYPSILHYGFIDGYSAMLQTYLRESLTVAVLCNGDPGPNLPFRGVRRAIVSEAL